MSIPALLALIHQGEEVVLILPLLMLVFAVIVFSGLGQRRQDADEEDDLGAAVALGPGYESGGGQEPETGVAVATVDGSPPASEAVRPDELKPPDSPNLCETDATAVGRARSSRPS